MTHDASGIPDRSGAVTARVLHTSDWHLGVTVRNHSRSGDHDAVIAQITRIAEAAQPDLILHTGDLFDSHRPPMAEFGRAIRALRSLAEVAPVAVLAGNHDSTVVFEVLADAIEDTTPAEVNAGTYDPHGPTSHAIRIHSRPTTAARGAVTTYPTRSGGHLKLVALPFVHANRVLTEFAHLLEGNATYSDQLRKVVAALTERMTEDFDATRDVAVFASHLHVNNARTSTEKLIHVAEDYATEPDHLPAQYGYLAFGHIHVPQPIASGRGCYAGSILEVDFGEEGEEKRVVIADLTAGRPTKVTSIPLTSGRRLHRLKAPLTSIATFADGIGDGIVDVTVLPEPDEDGSSVASDGIPIVIGERQYDSLAAAVADQLPDATIVGIGDARVVYEALEASDSELVDEPVGEAYRTWLRDQSDAVLRAEGGGVANINRVAELFDELHAAVTTDAEFEPSEEERLAELSGNS